MFVEGGEQARVAARECAQHLQRLAEVRSLGRGDGRRLWIGCALAVDKVEQRLPDLRRRRERAPRRCVRRERQEHAQHGAQNGARIMREELREMRNDLPVRHERAASGARRA